MRTIKLIAIGVAVAIFIAFLLFNWTDVVINAGPWSVYIKKPVLVLLSFLAGFVPTYLMHIAARTSWRRRLSRAEKAVTEAVLQKAPAPLAPTPLAPEPHAAMQLKTPMDPNEQ